MAFFSRALQGLRRQDRTVVSLEEAVLTLLAEARQGASPPHRQPAQAGGADGQAGHQSGLEFPQLTLLEPAQVIAWISELAHLGDMHAQYILGLFFQLGAGVTRDDSTAAMWFRKAAEQALAGPRSRVQSGATHRSKG